MKGRQDRRWGNIRGFMDVINKVGLVDLGMKGGLFTWCHKREGERCMWIRLD